MKHSPLAALLFLTAISPYRLTAQEYFQQSVQYTIRASLDEPSGVLTGIAQLVYRNNSRDTLREMYFHQYLNAFRPGSLWSADEEREGIDRFAHLPEPYNAFERFGEIRIEGASVLPDYPNAPDSTIAHVRLPRALGPGDSIVVVMTWQARPSVIPRRQGREGRRFDFAQWYPKVCVYDRGGWEAHPLHLAGELYGEYGTYDVTLDVAADQVIAATGVEDTLRPTPAAPRPGRKQLRFHADNIHHFAWSANPEYRIEEGRYGNVLLRTFYLPEDTATWGGGRVIARTRRAMAWLDSIFGPYPYPQVSVVHRIEGGGTEFPMMVMNGGPEESLIFHEVGHIYTYGILGNNEWKEAFLDEGFTTFQTAWNFQRRGMGVPSTATQQLILNLDLDDWSEPVSKRSEDYAEFAIYNRMVYTKAQLFYEMLRYSLGDDAFRRGLRLYYDRWKFRHVDEAAFRGAMEEASGRDLREFFQEWLHRTPLVDYRLRHVQRFRDRDSWVTEITVDRLGTGVMPVDIAVPAGDTVYTVRASGEPRRETVRITTPVRSGRVELDPARQTMDWNYLNNRENAGPLKFLGPVGPPSVNRFGWSGSTPSRRDRRVNNWMPLAWYNDAGGLNVGAQLRTNYMGRFDQDAVQLTFAPRNQPGTQTGNAWFTLRNPHALRLPRVRWGMDLFYVEGRRGGRAWLTMDRSPHLSFGPRVTVGFEASHINVTSPTYVDPSRWSDLSVTEIGTWLADRWTGDATQTDFKLAGSGGVAGDPSTFGLGSSVRTYVRGTVDLRHRRTHGRVELRTRLFGGGTITLGQDSLAIPQQRAIYLSGADPYETLANPFLRSRGALLARPDVNYQAPGGAGLRAYRNDLTTNLVGSLSTEASFTLTSSPSRRLFRVVSLASFADIGILGKVYPVTGAPALLTDAGVGLRARHRIGPAAFTTRVDFPLYTKRLSPLLPGQAHDFIWSLEESF